MPFVTVWSKCMYIILVVWLHCDFYLCWCELSSLGGLPLLYAIHFPEPWTYFSPSPHKWYTLGWAGGPSGIPRGNHPEPRAGGPRSAEGCQGVSDQGQEGKWHRVLFDLSKKLVDYYLCQYMWLMETCDVALTLPKIITQFHTNEEWQLAVVLKDVWTGRFTFLFT